MKMGPLETRETAGRTKKAGRARPRSLGGARTTAVGTDEAQRQTRMTKTELSRTNSAGSLTPGLPAFAGTVKADRYERAVEL